MPGEEQNKAVHVLFYTDGSSRPKNPGFCGWGCHGYTYIKEPSKKGHGLANYIVTDKGYIPKDNSNKNLDKQITITEYHDWCGGYLEGNTNNQGELMGFYHALKRSLSLYESLSSITIYTDSKYVLNGVTEWLEGWKQNNWVGSSGKPVANREIWEEIDDLLSVLRDKDIELRLEKVKAHSGHIGNMLADELASIGSNYSYYGISEPQYITSSTTKYWKPDVYRHPLLGFKRVLFNTVPKYNTDNTLFAMNHKKDEPINRKSATISYSVLKLPEIDSVLKTLMEFRYDLGSQYNTISIVDLDKLYKPHVYKRIQEHGKLVFKPDNGNTIEYINNDVLGDNVKNTIICTDIKQPAQAIEIIEKTAFMYDILNGLESGGDISLPYDTEVIDITEYFYTTDRKGKTILRPELDTASKKVVLKLKSSLVDSGITCIIKLLLGKDILTRNSLKKIERDNPKISICLMKIAENALEYCTAVKTDNGSGVFIGYYTNTVLVKKK